MAGLVMFPVSQQTSWFISFCDLYPPLVFISFIILVAVLIIVMSTPFLLDFVCHGYKGSLLPIEVQTELKMVGLLLPMDHSSLSVTLYLFLVFISFVSFWWAFSSSLYLFFWLDFLCVRDVRIHFSTGGSDRTENDLTIACVDH